MPGSPSPGTSRQRSRNASSRDAEPRGELAERLDELLRRVALVAGLERRVRREDDVPAHALERLLERHARPRRARAARSSAASAGWPSFRCTTAGSMPSASQHARAADAEQAVLREPDVRVAVVGARRRPAADRVVLGQLGVEQEQRHAADLHAPDLERDRAAEERRPRAAAASPSAPLTSAIGSVVGSWSSQYSCCVPVQVEPLHEVAAAVEEPDADHRQAAVARLLEHVARQHAEPARVAGQRGVHAELGARSTRPGPSNSGARRPAARRRRLELVREPVDALRRCSGLRRDLSWRS